MSDTRRYAVEVTLYVEAENLEQAKDRATWALFTGFKREVKYDIRHARCVDLADGRLRPV